MQTARINLEDLYTAYFGDLFHPVWRDWMLSGEIQCCRQGWSVHELVKGILLQILESQGSSP